MSNATDAFHRLRARAAVAEVASVCREHDVELLVAHGSVVDPARSSQAKDLDLGFLSRPGAVVDVLSLGEALYAIARCDGIDLMDIRRAGPVAQARALAPMSVTLYEQRPGIFATAQMAALVIEMETRYLRHLDLSLMAS